MTLNLKNLLNPKVKISKMGEFQQLQPIEGLEISAISADLYGDGRDDLTLFYFKEGANFEELAKKKSDDDASRESGGDLDVIYRGVFDPAFDKAISKLSPGQLSGKVETQFGFHVIKLIEKRPPEQAPFEELEQAIQKHLFMEEAKILVASYVKSLKKEATIKTFLK